MSSTIRRKPPDWQPIVALEHEHGVAAVCADRDSSLWLVTDLGFLGAVTDEVAEDDLEAELESDSRCDFGQELDGFELSGVGLTIDGAHAIAGRLPAGAATVTIRDDRDEPVPLAVAGGAFVATPARAADAGNPTVLFKARDGTIVRRPPPTDYNVEPAPKLDQRCPACGASSWEIAQAPLDEETAGEKQPQPSPAIRADEGSSKAHAITRDQRLAICVVCGHREQLPSRSTSAPSLVRRNPSERTPSRARSCSRGGDASGSRCSPASTTRRSALPRIDAPSVASQVGWLT